MTYLLENINTTIAKIVECMARDPKRAERLLGDVKRWMGELAAPSQTVSSQAEADAVFEAAQAGLPEIPFGPAFIDAYRKHYIAWGEQCFAAGAQAAPQASAEESAIDKPIPDSVEHYGLIDERVGAPAAVDENGVSHG